MHRSIEQWFIFSQEKNNIYPDRGVCYFFSSSSLLSFTSIFSFRFDDVRNDEIWPESVTADIYEWILCKLLRVSRGRFVDEHEHETALITFGHSGIFPLLSCEKNDRKNSIHREFIGRLLDGVWPSFRLRLCAPDIISVNRKIKLLPSIWMCAPIEAGARANAISRMNEEL